MTSSSDVHAVPVRLPITSKHCNVPVASSPSCQSTCCLPSQPSAETAQAHAHAAPCIIPFCTAEPWPQLDTQALLQQHQADVTTEQHHSEAVCHQLPSRHVQQASQLCQMQCTIQSLHLAQRHMGIRHKFVNRLLKVAELAHSLREDVMMQAVSAVHDQLNTQQPMPLHGLGP